MGAPGADRTSQLWPIPEPRASLQCFKVTQGPRGPFQPSARCLPEHRVSSRSQKRRGAVSEVLGVGSDPAPFSTSFPATLYLLAIGLAPLALLRAPVRADHLGLPLLAVRGHGAAGRGLRTGGKTVLRGARPPLLSRAQARPPTLLPPRGTVSRPFASSSPLPTARTPPGPPSVPSVLNRDPQGPTVSDGAPHSPRHPPQRPPEVTSRSNERGAETRGDRRPLPARPHSEDRGQKRLAGAARGVA